MAELMQRRKMPPTIPNWDLVPMEPAKQGFAGRLPPVTEAERLAVDHAVLAKKQSSDYWDLEVHFALEQQNGRAS